MCKTLGLIIKNNLFHAIRLFNALLTKDKICHQKYSFFIIHLIFIFKKVFMYYHVWDSTLFAPWMPWHKLLWTKIIMKIFSASLRLIASLAKEIVTLR